ncbi:fimbrial chaperone [Escherichia coli]|nr:fimbrial chaperone [Escherichia coli]EES0968020.1 fimbrial chaperone [Escherichia coli]EEW0818683.1 fimbrial chaperone [Escherichia coli]EFI4367784.1 fimbrial chaperone [Escherichia coli]EFJ1843072.1 fimbrial chaperone [Escherichia coli]
MNKFRLAVVTSLLALTMSSSVMAAFTLNGTRYIYEEGKKNISFEVTNKSDSPYGGQVWIENISQPKDQVFITPMPAFFKVNDKEKQLVRLMSVSDALPKDRESLFRLNVQELPPKPKESEGNAIALAMNTRVKVFYRPKALSAGREKAEEQVEVVRRGGSTYLKNPTPYYFALTKIYVNKKLINLDVEVDRLVGEFAPFSEIMVNDIPSSGEITFDAVDDWGGVRNYTVKRNAG